MNYNFEWDSWNTEHIKKHEVIYSEVEQACSNKISQQKTYKERTLFFGETIKGRKLLIVCKQDNNSLYVITARDMSRKEREYYDKTKTDKTI